MFSNKKKNNIPFKVLNALQSLYIADHLANNPTCANSYNLNRSRTIKNLF